MNATHPEAPPPDVRAVSQAVIDALLCRRWAELDRLVPRMTLEDPSPGLVDTLCRVE